MWQMPDSIRFAALKPRTMSLEQTAAERTISSIVGDAHLPPRRRRDAGDHRTNDSPRKEAFISSVTLSTMVPP